MKLIHCKPEDRRLALRSNEVVVGRPEQLKIAKRSLTAVVLAGMNWLSRTSSYNKIAATAGVSLWWLGCLSLACYAPLHMHQTVSELSRQKAINKQSLGHDP